MLINPVDLTTLKQAGVRPPQVQNALLLSISQTEAARRG